MPNSEKRIRRIFDEGAPAPNCRIRQGVVGGGARAHAAFYDHRKTGRAARGTLKGT